MEDSPDNDEVKEEENKSLKDNEDGIAVVVEPVKKRKKGFGALAALKKKLFAAQDFII
jgi:hypothetical protein